MRAHGAAARLRPLKIASVRDPEPEPSPTRNQSNENAAWYYSCT